MASTKIATNFRVPNSGVERISWSIGADKIVDHIELAFVSCSYEGTYMNWSVISESDVYSTSNHVYEGQTVRIAGSQAQGTVYLWATRAYVYIDLIVYWTARETLSPSTASGGSAAVGEGSIITLANAAANQVYHQMRWVLDETHRSDAMQVQSGTMQAMWPIPASWQEAISGSSASANVLIETYKVSDGTLVGAVSHPITVYRNPALDVTLNQITASPVTAGDTSTVAIDVTEPTHAYHVVSWSLPDTSLTLSAQTPAGATSASMLIPASWAQQFPSSTSALMMIQVQTYNDYGTLMGTRSVSVRLYAPNNIPDISVSVVKLRAQWGELLQHISQVYIEITAAAKDGATIEHYSIQGPNLEHGTRLYSSVNHATSGVLTQAGTLTYRCTCTDSRGRVAVSEVTVSVQAYEKPLVRSASARRDAAGNILCQAQFTFANVLQNSATAFAKIRYSTETAWLATVSLTNGLEVTVMQAASERRSYVIEITVTDTLGSKGVYVINVPTESVFVFFHQRLNSIGIGTYPEHSNAIEIGPGYHLYVHGTEMNPEE